MKPTIASNLFECYKLQYTEEYFKTQKDMANYILELNSAYEDCCLKLQAIKEIYDKSK